MLQLLRVVPGTSCNERSNIGPFQKIMGLKSYTGAIMTNGFRPPIIHKTMGLEQKSFSQRTSIGCQTVYRESETQTSPYSPPYIQSENASSELLRLKNLTWGSGLPPGRFEVEAVIRMRNRQAWLAVMPPDSDADQLLWKTELIKQIEQQEWQLREADIREIQGLRVKLMQRLLNEQEAKNRDKFQQRLETCMQQVCAGRDRQLKNITVRLERLLRRQQTVYESRLLMYPSLKHTSKQYAQSAGRNNEKKFSSGARSVRESKRPNCQAHLPYIQSKKGFEALYEKLDEDAALPTILKPKPPPSLLIKQRYYRKHRVLKQLDELYAMLQEEKRAVQREETSLRLMIPVERLSPAAPPPSHQLPALPSEEEEKQSEAVRLLQRLACGRAVQLRVTRFLRHRQQLVDELRTAHALHEARQVDLMSQQRTVTAVQRLQYVAEEQDRVVDEALSRIESAAVARLLALLSDELLRLQEERKIQAFCMLGERQREMLEAAEAGLRQKELRRRREIEEIFKHEMKIHQCTMEQYLEDVVLDCTEAVADDRAREHVRRLAAHLYRPENSSDTEAMQLIHEWMLPEMQRQKRRVEMRQICSRRLVAAQQVISSQLHATNMTNKENETQKN